MVNEFNGRVGLFLGIACAHTMSVCAILHVLENDVAYHIPGFISTLGMFIGFTIYCYSSTEVIQDGE